VKFGTNFDRTIDGLLIANWVEALADIDADLLEGAMLETERTTKFFPQPGTIREHISGTAEHALDLKATVAWDNLLRWIDMFYHVDAGTAKNAPPLSARQCHLSRACGGLPYLATCSDEQRMWARKTFIENYKLVIHLKLEENLLSDAEAKNILAGLLEDRKKLKSA